MSGLPQIPGYRIERELGAGGMATVYLGVQEKLNRRVAIKVLSPVLLADKQFIQRFLKEAETAANLHHSNIVPVYDVGQSGQHNYIVMEYLEESLKDKIKQVALAPSAALSIARQIASALDHAHREGFVHRDIKPENIMFRKDGTAILTDFGIARMVDSVTKLTKTGMSIGTPHYMSPEQAMGEKIDGRSDIYSLGIVLFEMLTGRVPYEAENTVGIIFKHIQEPIPELPARLSGAQEVVDRALAKKREDRFQTGEEMARELEIATSALQTVSVSAKRPSGGKSARTPMPQWMGPAIPSIGTKQPLRYRESEGRRPMKSKRAVVLAVLGIALTAAIVGLVTILSKKNGPGQNVQNLPVVQSQAPSSSMGASGPAGGEGIVSQPQSLTAAIPESMGNITTPPSGGIPEAKTEKISSQPAAVPSRTQNEPPIATIPSPQLSERSGAPAKSVSAPSLASPAIGFMGLIQKADRFYKGFEISSAIMTLIQALDSNPAGKSEILARFQQMTKENPDGFRSAAGSLKSQISSLSEPGKEFLADFLISHNNIESGLVFLNSLDDKDRMLSLAGQNIEFLEGANKLEGLDSSGEVFERAGDYYKEKKAHIRAGKYYKRAVAKGASLEHIMGKLGVLPYWLVQYKGDSTFINAAYLAEKISQNKSGYPEAVFLNDTVMIYVPKGNYQKKEFLSSTKNIWVESFWIQKYEMSIKQYMQYLMKTNKSQAKSFITQYTPTEEYPVTNLSWQEAVDYCQWLFEQTRLEFRLPKSDEWEKAATGQSLRRSYPWGDFDCSNCANTKGVGDGFEFCAPVTAFESGQSPFGVFNLLGNVCEYTNEGTIRGGHWASGLRKIIDTYGSGALPDQIGFRPVMVSR